MDKKKIVIVTGSGGILGTGHIQRMLNLAVQLNSMENYSATIFLKQNHYPLERKFFSILTDNIPHDASLIIRDMRDSSKDEIQQLKKTAPVLVIDDSGAGRESADYSLDLLPLPAEKQKDVKPDTSVFLYGYNFAEGISLLNGSVFLKRDIDIAVYAGYEPVPELLSSIRMSIPDSADSVLLKGGKAQNFTGSILNEETAYSEILSRAKIVLTHFGLTMFEADACGCRIAALNPSPYHGSLTETVKDDFNIIYSGTYESFSNDDLRKVFQMELKREDNKNFSQDEVLKRIKSGTDNFINYIKELINNKVNTISQ
jgi:hypothetical protein